MEVVDFLNLNQLYQLDVILVVQSHRFNINAKFPIKIPTYSGPVVADQHPERKFQILSVSEIHSLANRLHLYHRHR